MSAVFGAVCPVINRTDETVIGPYFGGGFNPRVQPANERTWSRSVAGGYGAVQALFWEPVDSTSGTWGPNLIGLSSYPDRVGETSTSVGTGSFTPGGVLSGCRTFAAGCPVNSHFSYTIEGVTVPGEYETGRGIWDGNFLQRMYVRTSSNSNNLVNFSAGTKNMFVAVISSDLQPFNYRVYVKNDFQAVGDGVTDDTIAINNALASVDPTKGQTLVFEPGVYLVPDGIIDRSQGLIIEGLGHISPGPGNDWVGKGVQIMATNPGKWCWTRAPEGNNVIQYIGGRIANIGFLGNSVTAGGLLISTGNNHIDNCVGIRHTTGLGIKIVSPVAPADAAAFQKLMNCMSIDCLTGLQVGDENGGAVYSYIYNFIAVKYTAGGIKYTGTGITSYDSETSFFGGHCESHATGFLSAGIGKGPMLIGMHFEDNSTWDIDLSRVSGASATRNLLFVQTSFIRVNSNQDRDMIFGGDSQYASGVDNGSHTMTFSNGINRVQIGGNTAAAPPTGGSSWELVIQNGRLYYNDNGTWKGLLGT